MKDLISPSLWRRIPKLPLNEMQNFGGLEVKKTRQSFYLKTASLAQVALVDFFLQSISTWRSLSVLQTDFTPVKFCNNCLKISCSFPLDDVIFLLNSSQWSLRILYAWMLLLIMLLKTITVFKQAIKTIARYCNEKI